MITKLLKLYCRSLLLSSLLLSVSIIAEAKHCFYETSEADANAKGAKVKVAYDCEWIKETNLHPVSAVSFAADVGDAVVGVSLSITKMPRPMTSKENLEIFTEKSAIDRARKLARDNHGEYISGRLVKIDGLATLEMVTVTDFELPMGKLYMASANYLTVVKNTICTMYYSAISKDSQTAKAALMKNLAHFRELASATIFVDQWN